MQLTKLLSGIFMLCACPGLSQVNNTVADSTTQAPLVVLVTDMKGKPAPGEVVMLKSKSQGIIYKGKSDVTGKFNMHIPAGDEYIISVKSLTDTTKTGLIQIPAPGPGEYFSEPFTVRVRFEAAKLYTLDNVHFDFGKATLRPDSFAELNELVDYLKNKPQIRIEIAGHTDNIGKDADNLKLSTERANTIRKYLLSKGIEAARVTAKGYGASAPVADNETEEGRQLNRRTEVRVLN
ncbi:MAG: OmpA family protein [Chitinophagaceae bacterium]|nr:OmpA family protein [Chitinophagaceae bacterium]